MIETSMPRASSGWLATWPKRPKPMISALAVQPVRRLDAVERSARSGRQPIAGAISTSGVSAIETMTAATSDRVLVRARRAGDGRGGVEHEGELAALRHQQRAPQRFGVAGARSARDDVDAERLQRHEADHAGR